MARDVWVSSGSDKRYQVVRTRQITWRGVPIAYSVTLELLPYTHVVYQVMLADT
jgi:hypothetical protein